MAKSCVLVIPASLQASANQISQLMGWGDNAYSVELGATRTGAVTHYGLRTQTSDTFIDLLTGPMPQALADGGYPPAVYDDVMNNLAASLRDASEAEGHFQDAIAALGLVVVEDLLDE